MTTASGGKIASKADFLTVIFDTVEIDAPKLGKLTLRELSAEDRTAYNKGLLAVDAITSKNNTTREEEAEALDKLESKIMAMHIVNGDGEFMFDSTNDDDIAILRKIPASIHTFIFNECLYLSKLRDRPKEEGGEPEIPLAPLTSSTTD